jgi:hypothetical protein
MIERISELQNVIRAQLQAGECLNSIKSGVVDILGHCPVYPLHGGYLVF